MNPSLKTKLLTLDSPVLDKAAIETMFLVIFPIF